MQYTFKTLTECWTVLYDSLARENVNSELPDFYESNPRNRKCHEIIAPVIRILEPQNCLMWSNYRKLSPIYLAKEEGWYQGGSRLVKDAPSKVWEQLQNTKGSDKGLVNSNYGAYIFTKLDEQNNQLSVWNTTINMLKKDPDTRQAIIQIPIMPHRGDKDTPCTSSIQFLLRNNKLNCIVYMRSCDLWFGFPNDATQFMLWQMRVANALDVELGFYEHHCGSLHVYEENLIKNNEEFNKSIDEIYIKGNEGIPYFKYFDTRDYKIIVHEILNDFEILRKVNKNKILDDNLLRNEELKVMLKQMEISNFIN